jgi:hypothetical protein
MPLVAWVSRFSLSISKLVPVLTRSWCLGAPCLPSDSDREIFEVVTKLFLVKNGSRAVFRINLELFSTRTFVPLVTRATLLCQTISFFEFVLTWPRCFGNSLFSSYPDCHVGNIVPELAVINDVARTVVRVYYRLGSSKILVPFVFWSARFG